MVLDLKINVRKENNIPIIELDGEIDVYTYPQLNDTIAQILKDGCRDVVVNLENVRYIDSTGLGVLANSANKISKNNGNLNIVCTKANIKKVFDVSGLLKKNLKVFEKETLAVEASR